MEKKVVLFGAGEKCKEAISILGKENIEFIIDNSEQKIGSIQEGIGVFSPTEKKEELNKYHIIISVGAKYEDEIFNQLNQMGLSDISSLREVKYEITRNKIENRPNYIEIYKKAIGWIEKNTIQKEGIICNSNLRKSYPEVSGYYIPTLLNWGYRDLATQYAGWLITIQKADGSWFDTDDRAPYVFDSAQILKGLIAIRGIAPEVDNSIIKGCEWILSNIQENGRLTTPDTTAWGNGRVCTELIHLYCLSPLIEAGKIFNRNDFIKKAEKVENYYLANYIDEIKGFECLSHFYAYIMEALIDLGQIELAKECMDRVAKLQDEDGMIPAYKDVHWVCSTGLFQFALTWYKIGEIDRGNKAFYFACRLQNQSGGWYGSYMIEGHDVEDNDYFPNGEISWANKYFLDALLYKNIAEFEKQAPCFMDTIDKTDPRYQEIYKLVERCDEKILDVGCGKGRYLNNLRDDFPNSKLYGVDLSGRVLEYITDDSIVKMKGSLLNIPSEDEQYDLVYTCEALEHAIDIESAIREMTRVTRKGGHILVIDKNADRYGEIEIGEWEQWFTKDYLRKIMEKYCDDVVVEELNEKEKNRKLFVVWKGIRRRG